MRGAAGGGGGAAASAVAAPTPLAGNTQARYKGLVATPGIIKFSQWKRETDIPKYEYLNVCLIYLARTVMMYVLVFDMLKDNRD